MSTRIMLSALLGIFMGLAVAHGGWPLKAQGTTLFMEGAANCLATSFWFPDVSVRMPTSGGGGGKSGKDNQQPGVEARLVLYNGGLLPQTVGLLLKTSLGPRYHEVFVDAGARQVVHLQELVGRDDDFALEVDFQSLGVADLKLWSGATLLAPSTPLALCR